MSKILKLSTHETKTFSRPEDGSYVGTVVGVVDLGTQPADAFGGANPKLLLQIELVDEPQEDGAPSVLLKEVRYTLSSGSEGYSPSTLFTVTKALLNMSTSSLEAYIQAGKFTIEQLLGKSAMVTVGTTSPNKERGFAGGRAKITTVAPLIKGTSVTEAKTADKLYFDIDDATEENIANLPEFLQKKVQQSEELLGQSHSSVVSAAGQSMGISANALDL